MYKTEVFYDDKNDINRPYVNYISIRADTLPPRVIKTYDEKGDVLVLPDEFLSLSINTARYLFDFKRKN